ncbi:hypothetical protein ACFYP4_02770 [Streptomyces sp. NPDC005551]|uniref:hypothetical protein n=1 Tax=Streptomyces sp. NPDC005551 TaxID=3364725 RepID=UPI0036B258C7
MPAPQPQQQPQPPAPEQQPHEVAQQSMSRTQWAKQQAGSCPSCGGSSYHTHPETPNARPHCYECGYPLTQSGSGITVQGNAVGDVKPARQTAASKTNSFNAKNIFHHLG